MKMIVPTDLAAAGGWYSTVPEDDAPQWLAGTVYPLGARVIRAPTHRVYESAISGNEGRDPYGDRAAWIDVGPTNRWAMFAASAGVRTVSPGSLQVQIGRPGLPGALALIDVDCDTIDVRVVKASQEIFQRSLSHARAAAFFDLPQVADTTVVVTLTNASASDPVAIGKLAIGDWVDLGLTEAGPTLTLVDYSRRETDDFGVTTVVERAWAKRLGARTILDSSRVDAVQRGLAAARATPAMWVGEDDVPALMLYGFYKDFAIDLTIGAASYCSLTVEGLPSADTIPEVVEPAIDGVSDLRVVRPQPITGDILVSSTVAETDHPAWSASATYAAGDRVLRANTHRIWESLASDNSGHDPAASSAWWVDAGPTNRWAMFDGATGTETAAAGQIVVVLEPDAPVSALALLDLTAGSVRVQAPSYDRTVQQPGASLTFLDLPPPAASITVTITPPAAGTAAVGTMLIGQTEPIGRMETAPSLSITDYTKKATDDFGNTTAVPRAWAKRLAAKAMLSPVAIDAVLRRVASLRGAPALWLGADGFDALTIYGFAREVSATVDATTCMLSLSIEGLTTAGLAPAPAVTLRPAGVYDPAVTYSPGDVVQQGGSSWLYIGAAAGSGNAPPAAPATENAWWRVMAQAGAQGPQGSAGAPGLNGSDGLPGAPGADGRSQRTHLAFANSANGTLDFTTGEPGGRFYVGIYQDFEDADSTSPAAYTWSRWRGADGANGIPGAPGADGLTPYTHFAYANSADGSVDFSQSPEGRAYLGQYTDHTEADSSDYHAYTWALIKGADGGGAFQLVDLQWCANPGTNSVTKRGGGEAWNGKAKTSQAYPTASVSGRMAPGSFVGLDSNPSESVSYTSIDYAWHRSTDGNDYIVAWNGNAQVFTGAGATSGNYLYTVTTDGRTVRFLRDGVEAGNRPHLASAPLFGTFAIFSPSVTIGDIAFAMAGAAGAAGLDGADGLNAKSLYVTSTSQTLAVDAAGALSPAGQDITFAAVKQNTSAQVTWHAFDQNGTERATTTGDQWLIYGQDALNIINAAGAGARSMKVVASLSDGGVLQDTVSVVKVQAGANGNPGPQGPAGVSAPQPRRVTGTGTTEAEPILLEDGATLTLSASAGVYVTDGGGQGTATMDLMAAVGSGGFLLVAQGRDFVAPFEPGFVNASGTVTNTTGARAFVTPRVVISGPAGLSINPTSTNVLEAG